VIVCPASTSTISTLKTCSLEKTRATWPCGHNCKKGEMKDARICGEDYTGDRQQNLLTKCQGRHKKLAQFPEQEACQRNIRG